MPALTTSPAYDRAIRAVADLLSRQKIDAAFVGRLAQRAWLGGEPLDEGSIDVVGLLGPQQKNQVATMAANRGFTVDRDEIEAAEELDLIPMRFEGIRIHLLVGSNALYGRMVADAVALDAGGPPIRVPRAEDVALLLQMSGAVDELAALAALPGFDRAHYNRRLVSIGLGEQVMSS